MDLLNKAANAATSAAQTVASTAQQALNSPTAQNLTSQAQAAATTALNAATAVAGQAHQQAHNAIPGVIPAPAAKEGGVVDQTHDLEPKSDADRAKLEKLFQERQTAEELKDKGILKGQPGDALAGKKAELEKSMLEDRLDKELASRPTADELVKRGILSPSEEPDKQVQ